MSDPTNPGEDDDQSDPGGDSDVQPDPARQPEPDEG
jgi:hypothetical protein